MNKLFSPIWFFVLFLTLFGAQVFAQSDASTPNGKKNPQNEELPKSIQETLAKQRIEREKKDYEELLQKSEEAVKLSQELEKSFTDANQLSSDDKKKLERLEKLIKKIRGELGTDDDVKDEEDEVTQKPSTLDKAFQTLKSSASKLFEELKKSTRYSISVIAIQSSSVILKIVKFIRFNKQ